MYLNGGFLNSNLETVLEKKNQNNPNTTQICFMDDMHLNWVYCGNRFREKIKISQIQPRFVLKLSINLKLGLIYTWTRNFLNSNWEAKLEKKNKKYPKYNPDWFWNFRFI